MNGTSLVVDTPAGVQQNDLMLVLIGWSIGGSITAPAGWTLNSSNGASGTSLYSYRRIAGASEPANYTWTFAASATVASWEGAYIGVDTTSPRDGVGQGSANGTTHTSPAMTNTNTNDLIVNAYSLNAIATFTTPTGVVPEAVVTAGSGPGASLAVFDGIQSSAGTVAAKTTTSSVSGKLREDATTRAEFLALVRGGRQ